MQTLNGPELNTVNGWLVEVVVAVVVVEGIEGLPYTINEVIRGHRYRVTGASSSYSLIPRHQQTSHLRRGCGMISHLAGAEKHPVFSGEQWLSRDYR